MRHGASFLLIAALLGLVLGGGLAHVRQPGAAAALRNAVFDQYQRWLPRPAAVEAPVRVIDIDDASLARLGQWPWPRARLAALGDRLTAAGAAAVGYDILFAEADRAAWPALAKELALPPALAGALAALPDQDGRFAASLAAGPSVLGFAVERGGEMAQPVDWPFRIVLLGPAGAGAPGAGFGSAVMPLPALAGAASGLGTISFVADGDGIVRRVPMVLSLAGQWVPSLGLELLRVAQGERNLVVETGGEGVPRRVRTGAVSVPVSPAGEFWLHYADGSEATVLPAWQVLAGAFDPAEVAGSIVLVGSSAKGLLDLRFSPLGGVLPGVEIHAQALRQVLSGHLLLRPWWAEAAELGALVIGSLLAAVLALRLRVVPAALTMLLLTGGIGGLGWQAFAAWGLLLDPALPVLAIVAVWAVASVAHHRRDEARQRWLRQAFARYLSPNLVDHLVRHPEALRLGGERRVCSFVFTDLAGYTRLMERLAPEQAVGLLNAYLDGMVAIAFRHQGTLDRIVGDAVAVLFSAPLAQPDHAERALACALEMARFSHDYAVARQAEGIDFGLTRIGVHCGEVIVGNFGGSTMFDYRALGDAVNTAARLESANKWIGTRVCMSAALRARCPAVPARPVGRLLLQGKTVPLAVFEPLTEADADYAVAHALLAAGDPAARAAFECLAVARPDDALVAFHCARLDAGESGDLIVLGAK